MISNVSSVNEAMQVEEGEPLTETTDKLSIPKGVELYEVNGPLFFGASHKFRETIKVMSKNPKILVIRMRHVPVIDATGLQNLKETIKQMHGSKTTVILSGVQPLIFKELEKSGVVHLVQKENVLSNIKDALERAEFLINK